jgi:Coenzyme PQQ synthesis protein D (PqqD)
MSVRSVDVSAFYELLFNPQYSPERSPNSHIEKILIDSKPTFVLMNELTQEYFEVDEVTSTIWDLLDGTKTLAEIYEEAKKVDSTLTQKEVKDVLVSLAEQGTIKSTEPEVQDKRVELVSATQLNVRLVKDSSKSLGRIFKFTNRLIRRWELYVALGIIAVGAVLSATKFLPLLTNKSNFAIGGSTLVGLLFYSLVVLLPVYMIHEFAHGSICAYYGGKPKAIGTGLYYFAPFFYCDTSDAWRLNKKARLMVSLAGPISTLLLGSFMVIATYFVPPGFGRHVLLLAQYLCFYGTLLNFSPVIEVDGYYALMDLTNMPNLRDESFGYLKKLFLRFVLGQRVALGRYSSRVRRLMLAYALGSFAWIIFFAYTTLTMTYYYSEDAFRALVNLIRIALLLSPFSLIVIAVSIASVLYYTLIVLGYGVMGKSAYDKARIRGVKLNTIHDKRAAIFLPLPAFFQRDTVSPLLKEARRICGKYSKSFSVIWEAPLCVVTMKLGKIEQSLEDLRRDMLSVEKSFKLLHYRFLSKNSSSLSSAGDAGKRTLRAFLDEITNQFSGFERKQVRQQISKLVKRQNTLGMYLLNSAYGTVWTLELSPDDYTRIRRDLFPSLIAEDLGISELDSELEYFKRHTVFGLETLGRLSSEVEQEASKVYRRPQVYQATAFIEPIKSRLVFVGRTEGIEGSTVWLGGLFLYQAWVGYINEILSESALGLGSIRQAQSLSFTKSQVSKLQDREIEVLKKNLVQFDGLRKVVDESLVRIRSAYQSAKNFHESLNSLLTQQNFDVGLYRPILRANEEHLSGLKEKIQTFQDEFERVSDQLGKMSVAINEQYMKRTASLDVSKQENPPSFLNTLFDVLPFHANKDKQRTPVYDAGVKLLFASSRLIYDVVVASDIVI